MFSRNAKSIKVSMFIILIDSVVVTKSFPDLCLWTFHTLFIFKSLGRERFWVLGTTCHLIGRRTKRGHALRDLSTGYFGVPLFYIFLMLRASRFLNFCSTSDYNTYCNNPNFKCRPSINFRLCKWFLHDQNLKKIGPMEFFLAK